MSQEIWRQSLTDRGGRQTLKRGTSRRALGRQRGGRFRWVATIGLSLGLALSTVGLFQPAQALVTTGSGGWYWQNPLPQGNDLNAISCPSTTTCFAVGTVGTILATTNGGSSWVGQNSGTAVHLLGISCPSPSTCYAVGDSGTILLTSNGGMNWSSQSSGTTASLHAVSCLPGSSSCFAVGVGGTIVATTGGAWSNQASDDPDDLEGISCPTITTCFAVGSAVGGGAGSIDKTANGGITWGPPVTTTVGLFAVSCPSTTTCFAVGDSGTILATVDGTTWAGRTSGTTQRLLGVICSGSTACAAVGAAGTITTFNGSSWFAQVSGTANLNGVSCPSGSVCLTVGDAGTMLASGNGGATWTSQSSAVTSNDLYGVSCSGPTVCGAVGKVGLPGPAGTIVMTTNAGLTWTSQTSGTAQYLAGISCPSATTCFAVGGTGTIRATTNGGSLWSTQTSNSSAGLLAVSCPSVMVCITAGTGGTILATANGGGSAWSPQTSGTPNQLRGISCPTTSACFAVGASGTIVATVNGGTTNWLTQSSGTPNDLNSVSCASATMCVAVGGLVGLGTIATTTNGGSTWSSRSVGANDLRGVSCVSATTCVAVGDGGTIVTTGNGGTTWSSQNSGTDTTLRAVSCPGQCWTVGLAGTILSNPLPPLVTAISPNSGPLAGGTTATISGTHFTGATIIHFGAATATPTVNSDTSITVMSPVSTTPGPVDVTVTTPIGTSVTSVTDRFTYGDTYTVLSTNQYSFPNSNGSTWQDIDSTGGLTLIISPSVNATAIVSANTDLWTANAGFNQDLGITVSGGAYPTVAGQPEAWKESGGFAGTFSPNAAFVQTVLTLSAGTTYTVKLQWKTNKNAAGATIFAGAGPISSQFSPTRLTAQLIPSSSATVSTKVSTKQYSLANNNGSTWQDVDTGVGLTLTIIPSVNATAIVGGNTDLWTANAGFNQDIGITVSGGAYPMVAGQPEAWKESGGFAGTFSPNAAFVQTVLSLSAGTTYTVKLQWKTNKDATGVATIFAGAGPIGGQFSPTRLTAQLIPTSSATVSAIASTKQYSLPDSNGSSWQDLDPGVGLTLTITPSSNCLTIVSGNADLWTANAGFNQDLGIFIVGGSFGTGQLVAWKESGGFAGTFSPNAAFVQSVQSLSAGTYTIKLQWKTNKAASGTKIFAGAGPIPSGSATFSPTRVTAQLVSCS